MIECEQLFGFRDGYTDIPGATETERYSAIGNSMAVPVMRWIGERISRVEILMRRLIPLRPGTQNVVALGAGA
jgi:hypothetical protein